MEGTPEKKKMGGEGKLYGERARRLIKRRWARRAHRRATSTLKAKF